MYRAALYTQTTRGEFTDHPGSHRMVTPLWLLWCQGGCNAFQWISCTPILNWLVPSLLTLTETLAQFVPLFSLSVGLGCWFEHSQLTPPEEAEAVPRNTRSKPFAVFIDNNFRLTLSTWYIGSNYITSTGACHIMSAKVNIQCEMIQSNTVQGYCLLS